MSLLSGCQITAAPSQQQDSTQNIPNQKSERTNSAQINLNKHAIKIVHFVSLCKCCSRYRFQPPDCVYFSLM